MDPENPEVLFLLSSALEKAGEWARAAEYRKKIVRQSPFADQRKKLSFAVGRLYLRAGFKALERGERAEAVPLLEEAVHNNPGLVQARIALATLHPTKKMSPRRIESSLAKEIAEIKGLAVKEDGILDLLPEPLPARKAKKGLLDKGEESPPKGGKDEKEDARGQEILPLSIVSELLPDSPKELGKMAALLSEKGALFRCNFCRDIQEAWKESCENCLSWGTLSPLGSQDLHPVHHIKEIMDEVEENDDFIRLLIRHLLKGDDWAEERLIGIGSRIIGIAFDEMMRVKNNRPLIHLLARMGSDHLPHILQAYRSKKSFSSRNLLREGMKIFRSYDSILIEILVGMGEGIENFILQNLFTPRSGDLKEIGISVLGLRGEAQIFEAYSEILHPKEVIGGLNGLEGNDLKRLIENSPAGGFLISKVFSDKTFQHERALVENLVLTRDKEKIASVLKKRGFSADLYQSLEPLLAREGTRKAAREVIQAFGAAATDHLISSFVSSETPSPIREEIGDILFHMGIQPVERLIDGFTGRYLKVEQALTGLLERYGETIFPLLMEKYTKETMLHWMGLNREKLLHRRKQIVRIFSRIGTPKAKKCLLELYNGEADKEMKSRIAGVLERFHAT